MLKFQAKIYSINDVLGWHTRKEMILSPYFQRRKVWSPRGKSFLIDSIIKGCPLPQFFIREKIITSERKTIREVVDGQQRLTAIIEFIEDKFTIMEIHNKEHCKQKFSELKEDLQQSILSFPLSVNTLVGIDEGDVLEIFARINTYTITLNSQEKLNAEYVGAFKQKIDYLSKTHLVFWEDNKILSKDKIARMKEVELTAELVIAMMNGLQDGKGVIKKFYKDFDDNFPQFDNIESKFADCLELCREIFEGNLKDMVFSRSPLFYSVFCALFDCKYNFSAVDTHEEKKIDQKNISEVREKLYQLDQAISGEKISDKFAVFVKAAKSSTDSIKNRKIRHEFLKKLFLQLFEV